VGWTVGRHHECPIVIEFSHEGSTTDVASLMVAPPAYDEDGLIRPVTAAQNLRYDNNMIIYPENVFITSGLHSSIAMQE